MFDSQSRYFSLENGKFKAANGRNFVYKKRRFLPPTDKFQTMTEVAVAEGDRLDSITARIIDDPEQFWRIADANGAMNPFELTEEIGKKLRIPLPQV